MDLTQMADVIVLSSSDESDSNSQPSPSPSPVKQLQATKANRYRRLILDLEEEEEVAKEKEGVAIERHVKRRALMFDDDETSDESDSCSGKSCAWSEDEVKPDVSYCTSTSRKRSLSGEEVSDDVTSSSHPIFESPVASYSGERILEILLDPNIQQSKVCRGRPSNIIRSATFVVDLDSLKHPDDIKKDDFGKWKYSGSHVIHYASWHAKGNVWFERISSSSISANVFLLRRIHCYHPMNSQFQRLLAFVTDPKGSPHHLCLLSYSIPPEGPPLVAPHGNSKSREPFYPTLASTRAMVKQNANTGGPKHVMSIVSESLGGVMSASSPCDLPRNERQIAYIKRASKGKSAQHLLADPLADQIFAIMQQTKQGDRHGLFVRDTRPCPEPAFVLARDRQLDDLERFCTNPSEFSVLTIDPTFNLGDFDVTPTTYHHLLLESVRYSTCPIFVGPSLVHYRKTFNTYLFFASTLVGLRRGLEAVCAIGTDGEEALADAFTHEFHYATHLTCFTHFCRNLKLHLHSQGYPESLAKEIIDDILGRQHDEVFSEGIVDCTSETEFDTKLAVLESRWEKMELSAGIQPGFFRWFCKYKEVTLKKTMLRSIREQAGMGCPPQPFTTNASETVNSMLKRHVNFKSSQLVEFVEKLKELVDEQEREVERAVIGRGKYRFKNRYHHLTVDEKTWFKMTEKQRRRHMHKVATAVVKPSSVVECGENESVGVTAGEDRSHEAGTSGENSKLRCLSVEVTSLAADVYVPKACLEGIWLKATELLNSPGSITPAPGNSSQARMVMSRSGHRPHLVSPCKGVGKFKCDAECANFKSLSICSHTVAVAELNDLLPDFLNSFKKAKKKPNFTKLSVHDMPAGRGRKGSQAPRRRKDALTPTIRTDRIKENTQSVSTSGDSATVCQTIAGNNSPTVNISLDPGLPGTPTYSSRSGYPCPSGYPGPSSYPSPSSYPGLSSHPGPSSYPGLSSYPGASTYPAYSSSCGWPAGQWYQSNQVPPMAEENTPFNLCFISGNITKCAGCGNRYLKPPTPPYDLCIQHREWRSFILQGSTPQRKFSPAYYHVNLVCIRVNWPMFKPEDLVVPEEVNAQLRQEHKDLLRSFVH